VLVLKLSEHRVNFTLQNVPYIKPWQQQFHITQKLVHPVTAAREMIKGTSC